MDDQPHSSLAYKPLYFPMTSDPFTYEPGTGRPLENHKCTLGLSQ